MHAYTEGTFLCLSTSFPRLVSSLGSIEFIACFLFRLLSFSLPISGQPMLLHAVVSIVSDPCLCSVVVVCLCLSNLMTNQ